MIIPAYRFRNKINGLLRCALNHPSASGHYVLTVATLLVAFLFAAACGFLAEDIVSLLFDYEASEETTEARWQHRITASAFAGLAALIFALVSFKIVSKRMRADARSVEQARAFTDREERLRRAVPDAANPLTIHAEDGEDSGPVTLREEEVRMLFEGGDGAR